VKQISALEERYECALPCPLNAANVIAMNNIQFFKLADLFISTMLCYIYACKYMFVRHIKLSFHEHKYALMLLAESAFIIL
jgi:hypothetical protein